MEQYLKDITEFIFMEDEPQPGEVIFVPGSGYPQIACQAARLWKAGLAPLIVVSGRYPKALGHFPGPEPEGEKYGSDFETEADFLEAVLLAEGVSLGAVIKDTQAEFTMENAVNSRRILDARGIVVKNALIACQAFHARRSFMYYSYAFPDTKLILCPAKTQGIDRNNWMDTLKGRQRVFGELERCGQQFGWILAGDSERNIL